MKHWKRSGNTAATVYIIEYGIGHTKDFLTINLNPRPYSWTEDSEKKRVDIEHSISVTKSVVLLFQSSEGSLVLQNTKFFL